MSGIGTIGRAFQRIGCVGATLLLIVGGLVGCSRPEPRLEVGPPSALVDGPLQVRVSGLDPGQQVRLDGSATDQGGRVWSSNATFVAGHDGAVDVASTAPVAGSYTGAHDTGLIWSMTPANPESSYYYVPPSNTMVLHLSVSINGRKVAGAETSRLWQATGVTEHRLTPQQDAIDGVMYEPADTTGRHPAVLTFGGSEGGLSTQEAMALASHGYPALAIAYFRDPGLPDTLTDIPLEYFATALRWLAAQPGVDPNRMAVAGTSRGSEAALLVGAYYPDLVHAVLALSPSSVVNPALQNATRSAWTLHGAEVPFVAYNGQSVRWGTAAGHPEAAIPVELIRGPIFLLCGDDDELWPSCPYSAEIMARRTANHTPYPDVRLVEPVAGHFVGSPLPGIPASSGSATTSYGTLTVGGTQQTDALGRLDAWPRLLAFLADLTT